MAVKVLYTKKYYIKLRLRGSWRLLELIQQRSVAVLANPGHWNKIIDKRVSESFWLDYY